MGKKSMKTFIDDKGHLIGRNVGDILVDGKGKNIGRYNESSNRTLDGKGKNIGVGNQTLKQLKK
jgi:hypothetical protein